ncbi:hypothetical protein KORDIASMS9_02977 [Kordia sp. SMS9]|uniref:hypothetical protein n=1 Tax=Kordia sp. SMS9 TaxID=2282170 RepID=UPI000E0D315B|nr:hypothetical protein [Kordia sp. SMS9]AXG70731.1 hypothetical protein KORDIASMS9_02977 [Kordia sp. SMS9]
MKKANLKNLQLNKKLITKLTFHDLKGGRAGGNGETSKNDLDPTGKECATCCGCLAAPVRNE